MKAIRKADGKEIDVVLYHEKEYLGRERDDERTYGMIYRAGDLIIDEPTDWSAFRKEAAKDLLCAMHCAPGPAMKSTSEAVRDAIEAADELIKQLKDA